ncbi:TetR/AcrR family transcriptional regulator [Fodinicola feengrottensis]|uniref:TetR/AcrR family transcriptional regulator n=1 Tax=Fodinicola feengrottensis TaxID=435914 RepID=A0ABP4S593_9ACTN
MAPRQYENARAKILDAAVRVITRDGVSRLSVDLVAAEAGISKGGFFYHFKTKVSLLGAVVEYLHDEVGRTIAEHAGDGDWLRRYVEWGVLAEGADADRMSALLRVLLLAADDNPAILDGARAANTRTIGAALAQGADAGTALVVQLTLDGLWLNQALGTLTLDRAERLSIRDSLFRLIDSTPSTKDTQR